MNKYIRIVTLAAALALTAMLFAPAAAQDMGSGAPIIEPNFGDDPTTFNPIIANDGTSYDVINRMFPDFIGVDSATVQYMGGAKGALVSSWDIAEDGVTYTFHLRDDLVWSDGVPITASDVAWFLDAVLSGETSTPRQELSNRIASYEVVDDNTLTIVFNEANCTLIDTLNPVYPVPAHVYEEVYGDDYAGMDESDYNLNPTTTGGGVFVFSNFRPGEQTTLLANADFGNPGGWWPCCALGEGDLDLRGALGELRAAGFGGLACVEIGTLPDGSNEDEVVTRSVDWLREAIAEDATAS